MFHTAFQGLSAGIMYGVPPYGYNYLSPAPPLFETPFITAADGTDNGQRFPLPPPPLDASASNPYEPQLGRTILPVNADPFFATDNKMPYSRELHDLVAARVGAEHGRDAPATWAAAVTTCWSSGRPTPAIPRCA